MSTILTVVTEGTTVETFQTALAEGKVRFYRVRENDTFRHIPYFAEGTKDREVGEWVLGQREEGVTMKAIAAEMHVSVPSVRRLINAVILANEVEDYDAEDIADLLEDAAVEPAATTEAVNDQPEPAAAETVTVAATSPEVLAMLGVTDSDEQATDQDA